MKTTSLKTITMVLYGPKLDTLGGYKGTFGPILKLAKAIKNLLSNRYSRPQDQRNSLPSSYNI
jgi:hypothetical protein